MKLLSSIKETAQVLGLGRTTIYALIKEGRLETVTRLLGSPFAAETEWENVDLLITGIWMSVVASRLPVTLPRQTSIDETNGQALLNAVPFPLSERGYSGAEIGG